MADPTNLITPLEGNVYKFTQDGSDFLLILDPKETDEKITSSSKNPFKNMQIFSLNGQRSPFPAIPQEYNPQIIVDPHITVEPHIEVNGSGSLKKRVAIFVAGIFIGFATMKYGSLTASTLGRFVLNKWNLNLAQRAQNVIAYISSLNPLANVNSSNEPTVTNPQSSAENYLNNVFFEFTNLANTDKNISYSYSKPVSTS